jgi:outer membrane protein assembly factor BamB
VGADRIVYFADDQGTVYAVNTKGTSEWSTKLSSPVRSPGTLAGPSQLVFALENGGLAGLQCTSDRLAEGWPKYRGTLAQSGWSS